MFLTQGVVKTQGGAVYHITERRGHATGGSFALARRIQFQSPGTRRGLGCPRCATGRLKPNVA